MHFCEIFGLSKLLTGRENQGWAILGFDKLYYTNTIPDKTFTILYYTYTNTIPTFWSGFQACNEYILHGKNPLKMKRGSKLFHFIFNIS